MKTIKDSGFKWTEVEEEDLFDSDREKLDQLQEQAMVEIKSRVLKVANDARFFLSTDEYTHTEAFGKAMEQSCLGPAPQRLVKKLILY